MFKSSHELNQMKKEDKQYGEQNIKNNSSKNQFKHEKHRQDFRKMTTQDFAKMNDDYEEEE